MPVLARQCPYCGFTVHAIAQTFDQGMIQACRLFEGDKRHKATCYFERLPIEEQRRISLEELLRDSAPEEE